MRWEHTDADASTIPSQPPKSAWSVHPTVATFRSFGNQKVRTHTEQLGYQNDPSTRSVIRNVNNIVAAATSDDGEIFVTPVSANANRLVSGFATPWHDLPEQLLEKLRTLRGIYNLNVPPHALVMTNYLSTLADLVRGGVDPSRATDALLKNIFQGRSVGQRDFRRRQRRVLVWTAASCSQPDRADGRDRNDSIAGKRLPLTRHPRARSRPPRPTPRRR